jgi:hypothetical protein
MTEIRERAGRRAGQLLRRPPSSGPINRRTELARRSIHHKPHATLITAPPSSAEISRIFADFFRSASGDKRRYGAIAQEKGGAPPTIGRGGPDPGASSGGWAVGRRSASRTSALDVVDATRAALTH